jgi:hypothetical protein
MGASIALACGMAALRVDAHHYDLNDGLGYRWTIQDPLNGLNEVLRLAPELAKQAAVEPAIRARIARLANVTTSVLCRVHRIDCDAAGIRVVAESARGVRLSDLLEHLEGRGGTLPEDGMLELVGRVARALAVVHALPGGLAHGAVTPAH